MLHHFEKFGRKVGGRTIGDQRSVRRPGLKYSDLADDFDGGDELGWVRDGPRPAAGATLGAPADARTYSNMSGSSFPGSERSDGESSDDGALAHAGAAGRGRGLLDTSSPKFNMFVGVMIIINAILIGAETEYGEASFKICEYIFCVFFVVELCLRMYSESPLAYVTDPWNVFDCVLVFLSVADIISSFQANAHTTTSFSVFRTFRMLRILRTLRLFHMFRELLVILHAFAAAFSGVLWIGLLVFLLDYVCAVFLTQAIGHNAHLWDEDQEQIEVWFGHVGSSMRTLFIVMTLSEWETISFTLSKVYTEKVVFPLMITYILCASYTMLSLITGVICEALLDAQRQDEMHKMKQIEDGRDHLFKALGELLESLDKDGDGAITRGEVELALQADEHLLPKLWSLEIHVEREDIFSIHDRLLESTPGKESVPTAIFLEELMNQTGLAKASHCTNLRAQMLHAHAELKSDVHKLNEKFDLVLQCINAPSRDRSGGAGGAGGAGSGRAAGSGPLAKAGAIQSSESGLSRGPG